MKRWIDQPDKHVTKKKPPNHDLSNTGWVLYPLSYENSWRARSFNQVHMWQASCTLAYFSHLSLLMMTSTVQMQAVCRMSVTCELSYLMTLLFMSSCSSVNRAPNWCLWGQVQFLSVTQFFFSLTLVSCSSIHPSHLVTKLNQIYHLLFIYHYSQCLWQRWS